MSVNRRIAVISLLRTRVLWLATSLLLTVSDRTCGQTPTEHPTLIFSIEENSQAGTEVGALAELFPELNNFRFSNRSRSTLFQVHPDTGVISVRDGARLDFERRPVVTLTIVADIREEQDDPYLSEFAESLRDEGFSSRTLSRLIPLEQRIQVQVQLRDVKEADEIGVVTDTGAQSESAGIVDESAVVPAIEPSDSEAPAVTTHVDPTATVPAMSENGSLDKAITQIPTPADELYPPVTQRLTPKSTATVDRVQLPETSAPVVSRDLPQVEVAEGSDDTAVPLPADVPPVDAELSTGNGRTLTLSETSGQAALQLNAATDAGAENATPNSGDDAPDSKMINAEIESAEGAAHPPKIFLLRSLVSLVMILGTAYLLRRRWKSFRRTLPEPQEEQVTEASASNELDALTVNVAADDQAEVKAADEFVKESIQEEPVPQLEQAIKAVITQESDADSGAPFDPESLIDDDYFNDSDDLQSLKAKNAELGNRLEALAGAIESVSEDPRRIDDLLSLTNALSGSASAVRDDKRSEMSEDDSDESDSDFIERSSRDDRTEFILGRSPYPTYDQETESPVEPRWSSDWPGYSEEKSAVSTVSATEAVASLAAESKASAVNETTDDKIASLRNELADLFAMQKKAEVADAKPVIPTQSQREDAEDRGAADEASDRPEPCPEETHLESVAQYLSQLLERSKKEEVADAIFVDRRKSGDKPAGKWDGVDRRGGTQKPKAPVKSYIESYLSEHGGELSYDSGQQRSSESPSDTIMQPVEHKPPVERRPVDVQAIRQHMNSFRNVASTALEHALASHRIRQAKGKVAWRTTLVVGLSVVSALAIATNSAMKIYFPSLGWLMGLIVCLATAELILRVEAIRRHRRELRYRILEPAKKPGDRSGKISNDGAAVAEDASGTLS